MEDKDLREENLQEEATEMQAEAEVTEAVEAEVVDETEAKWLNWNRKLRIIWINIKDVWRSSITLENGLPKKKQACMTTV